MSTHKAIYVGLFSVILLGLLWTITSDASGLCNDTSRLATADAIVNHGTLSINKSIFFYTCDRIKIGADFFSDKPPFLSLFYAFLLFCLQGFWAMELPKHLPQIYKGMTLLSSGFAFCGIVALLYLEAQKKDWPRWFAFCLALLCVSATQVFVFASVLNSHIIAAAFLLWFWIREKNSAHPGLSGGILGAAVVIDPLAVSFIGAWLWVMRKSIFTRKRFFLLLLGGLIPVSVHSILCWSISGSWLTLNLNPEHFQFVGSIHNTKTLTGLGLKHSSISSFLSYAFHSLVGHHGFFIYNTITVFGLLALFLNKKKSLDDFRVIVLTFLFFFILTIGFSDNHSGGAYGNRWHVLLVPLALYGLFTLEPVVFKQQRVLGFLFVLVSIWGLAISRIGLIDPWSPYFWEIPSFIVQFEEGAPYWDHEQKMSDGFLQTNHLHEAIHFGELALRRDSSQVRSWTSVVTAAITLQDFARIEKYAADIKRANLPASFKDDILRALREAQKQ